MRVDFVADEFDHIAFIIRIGPGSALPKANLAIGSGARQWNGTRFDPRVVKTDRIEPETCCSHCDASGAES